MKNNDETILEILQGHKTTKWPTAKLVKIFIASTKPGKTFIYILGKTHPPSLVHSPAQNIAYN